MRAIINYIGPNIPLAPFQAKTKVQLLELAAESKINDPSKFPESLVLLQQFDQKFAKKGIGRFSQIDSLIAWDAVRLANITRWAIDMGYIERSQFTQYAGQLTSQMKSAYADWNQAMLAYFAGAILWQSSESRAEGFFKNMNMLVNDENCPFKKIAFK